MRIRKHIFYTEIEFQPKELEEAITHLPKPLYTAFLTVIHKYTGMFPLLKTKCTDNTDK